MDIPLGVLMALRLYAPDALLGFVAAIRHRLSTQPETTPLDKPGTEPAWGVPATQEITVSSLESRVSTS